MPLYARRADGSETSIELTLSPLNGPADGQAYLAAVVRDCGEHGVPAVVLLTSGLSAVPGLVEQVTELV